MRQTALTGTNGAVNFAATVFVGTVAFRGGDALYNDGSGRALGGAAVCFSGPWLEHAALFGDVFFSCEFALGAYVAAAEERQHKEPQKRRDD